MYRYGIFPRGYDKPIETGTIYEKDKATTKKMLRDNIRKNGDNPNRYTVRLIGRDGGEC